MLSAFHRVAQRVPQTRLVVAPRHPERFAAVPALVEAGGFRRVRRSALEPRRATGRCSSSIPSASSRSSMRSRASSSSGVASSRSGAATFEPALPGKAVVVGPHMTNFREIADQFRSESAMVQVGSPDELAREVSALLLDEGRRRDLGERARDLVGRNRGAVSRTTSALSSLLA